MLHKIFACCVIHHYKVFQVMLFCKIHQRIYTRIRRGIFDFLSPIASKTCFVKGNFSGISDGYNFQIYSFTVKNVIGRIQNLLYKRAADIAVANQCKVNGFGFSKDFGFNNIFCDFGLIAGDNNVHPSGRSNLAQ